MSIALQGDYGKPRPALIIQSDLFEGHSSATLLPITGSLIDAPSLRVTIPANTLTGLRKVSQVMTDKIQTVPCPKIGSVIGKVDAATLSNVERNLLVFLGLG